MHLLYVNSVGDLSDIKIKKFCTIDQDLKLTSDEGTLALGSQIFVLVYLMNNIIRQMLGKGQAI